VSEHSADGGAARNRCRDQTYREIAQALTDRGIKTPRGGDTWNQVTVMRVMKRLGISGK
jgi:hypothetical protein